MSKRHQSSRRKSYGRRQHEVRERALRRRDHELLDVRVDTFGVSGRVEALGIEVDRAGRVFTFAPTD